MNRARRTSYACDPLKQIVQVTDATGKNITCDDPSRKNHIDPGRVNAPSVPRASAVTTAIRSILIVAYLFGSNLLFADEIKGEIPVLSEQKKWAPRFLVNLYFI